MKLKVHVTDNHNLVIEGFKSLLSANQIDVVGSSNNGDELIKWLEQNSADIVLLDVSMPVKNGIEVLEHFNKLETSHNFIVVSAYLRFDLISLAMNLGAKGFVFKTEAAESILEALEKVNNGEYYYSTEVKELLVNESLFPCGKNQDEIANMLLSKSLSAQELRVLKMLVNEYSSDQIEEELNIKKSTIRTYTSRIREKLNSTSNVALALRFSFLKTNNN